MGVLAENNGVNAQFLGIADKLSINFADPAYAKAENIIYNSDDRAVHAVLHEGMVFLGTAPQALDEKFKSNTLIELRAEHFAGQDICLKASLSVV